MKLKLMVLPLLLFTFSASSWTGEFPESQNTPMVETRTLDKRARILADYFAKYNSPLEYQAQDFIDSADKFGLDWKLVPAISGVESTFGKNSYGYNAWGWGIYGSNRLGFKSWKEGINTVSEGLKRNYVDRGLTNPFSMNRVYAESKTWGYRVDYFMKDINKFEEKYEPQAKSFNPQLKTARASAQLAFKSI